MNTMRSLISRLFKKKEAPVSRKADTQYPLKIPGIGGQLSMVTHEVNDAHISTTIRREGIWEPEETRFIIEALKTGDTFVDVGANIGYFSVLASRLAGAEGRVIAFEPDPENFRLLEENCKNNSCRNVTCHEAALSDTTGR